MEPLSPTSTTTGPVQTGPDQTDPDQDTPAPRVQVPTRTDHVRRDAPTHVSIRDVSVHYGDFTAIRDVSFDVARHQITALIGPSGCGKSTLLRAINRMNDLVPTARVDGAILYNGEDIYGVGVDPVEVRRRIGMVFQKPNPFPKSIYENVAYGVRVNGLARRRAELDEVVDGLFDAHRVPHRDSREWRLPFRMAERHCRQAQFLGEADSGVVVPEVGEEDAVDAAVGGEFAVGGELSLLIGDDAEHERLPGRSQFPLDAGDERGIERIAGDDLGITGDHQAECERAVNAQ